MWMQTLSWTCCYDELPKLREKVLICMDDGTVCEAIRHEKGWWKATEYYTVDGKSTDIDSVLAWMPMPDPVPRLVRVDYDGTGTVTEWEG